MAARDFGVAVSESVALATLATIAVVTLIICITILVAICMFKRKHEHVDGGNDGQPTLPVVSLARPRGSANQDMTDELSCRHVDANGKLCSYTPPKTSPQNMRVTNAKRHAQSAPLHVDFCRPSCSECVKQFGYPVREAAVLGIAQQYNVEVSLLQRASPSSPSSSSANISVSSSRSLRRSSSTTLEGDAVMLTLGKYDFFVQLAANCKSLVSTVSRSLLYEVIRILTAGLQRNMCEEWLDLNERRIQRANEAAASVAAAVAEDRPVRVLANVVALGITRRRKHESVDGAVRDFWLSLCRQSRQVDQETGERKDIWYLGMRKEEAWVRYASHCVHSLADGDEFKLELPELKFGDIYSFDFPPGFYDKYKDNVLKRSAFLAAMPGNVRAETLVESSCPICREGMRAEDTLRRLEAVPSNAPGDPTEWEVLADDDEERKELKAAVKTWNEHKAVVANQRQKQIEQRDMVGTRGHPDMLMVCDFSPFAKVYDCRRSLSEAMGDTQNLIVSIYYRKGGELQCLNIDNFAQESNDHVFFRRVLLNVFSLDLVCNGADGVQRPDWIEIWSDGGPKHFKIRRSIFFVCVELKQRHPWLKRVTWAFYASHHGKSVNDAHAAVVKRTLWRLAREGCRTEGPRQLADVAAHLKNTDSFYFDKFDREQQFNVSSIPGIKSSHFFEWDGTKEGDKHVIVLAKVYPAVDQRTGVPLQSDDGNVSRITVESFYSVDFDDCSGAAMDVSSAEQREHAVDAAKKRREERTKERIDAALARFREAGTEVQVRYDVEGKSRGQWWNGVVEEHRRVRVSGEDDEEEEEDAWKEQIKVKYVVDKAARSRGLDEEMSEWVDLDTDVRLAG